MCIRLDAKLKKKRCKVEKKRDAKFAWINFKRYQYQRQTWPSHVKLTGVRVAALHDQRMCPFCS